MPAFRPLSSAKVAVQLRMHSVRYERSFLKNLANGKGKARTIIDLACWRNGKVSRRLYPAGLTLYIVRCNFYAVSCRSQVITCTPDDIHEEKIPYYGVYL